MRGDPWFIYKLSAGRFRAAPASWQGWVVLIGGILLTMVAVTAAIAVTEGEPLGARIGLVAFANLAGIGAILLTAYRTGRPSR
ncbi:hypothetical protein GCM10022281_20700 [Sphingomonas rosea]|uniref:Uncharacterized protein n=1 Tax=Sphingomonas rosea TaxID=335605 RepID=A0ABP7UBP2_9SPHN